jgi:membrane protease YdiL (CAAX protease family)
MQTTPLFGWILLIWLGIVLPRGAMRSARLFNAPDDEGDTAQLPPRKEVFLGTILVLVISFVLAWLVADAYGWDLFTVPTLGLREVAAGAVALGVMLLLRQVSDWIRSPEERRTMPIRKLIPHDRGDWALYGITAVLAGIAEEAAYRGALMSVLIGLTGSTALSVMISALAFTLGHAVQGGKSMVLVFAMALLMHGLVFVTGTLVVAMVVHAGYDLLAGALGARDAVASA